MAQQKDGVFTWLHSDHLHSATVLADADGLDIRRLASGLLALVMHPFQGKGDGRYLRSPGWRCADPGLLYE
ncbi:MAG: hypothetical protein JW902_08080, partial [Syntrophaceae bacterium]|nr:hypothetical protein [Syntrophaceae bacterium]